MKPAMKTVNAPDSQTEERLERLIREHQAGADHSYALYSALVLEMFLDHEKA